MAEIFSQARERRTDREERKLIQQVKVGDHEAFEAIFRRYVSRVYRRAVKLVGNESDAEDVVQEVFLAVYEKAKTFRGESAFSTWLYRLTVNMALTKLRRRKKEEETPFDDYLPRFREDGHHQVRPVVDWSEGIDKLLVNKEFQGVVREAIDSLPPVDKAVLLSDLDGFSNLAIAEALGLSVQAVKARLHRARLFLRGKLAVHLGHSPT